MSGPWSGRPCLDRVRRRPEDRLGHLARRGRRSLPGARTDSAAPRRQRAGGNPPPPNWMITGTGPVALAGVVKVAWMLTLIAGYAELSTLPSSCLVTIGDIAIRAVQPCSTTVQVTFGAFFGVRP